MVNSERDYPTHVRIKSVSNALLAGILATAGTMYANSTVSLPNVGTTYPGFVFEGGEAGLRIGSAISGAGDFNGDSFGDVIVGSPRSNPEGDTDAGECFVIFGQPHVGPLNTLNIGDSGIRIRGARSDDRLGYSVSGTGDTNGDGFVDIAVRSWNIVSGRRGPIFQGAAFVVFGSPNPVDASISSLGTGGFTIDGPDNRLHSGRFVSGAGDVNGDGFSDVLVSADKADTAAGSYAGRSFVAFGDQSGANVNLLSLGNTGFLLEGVQEDGELGQSVSGAGDVNGDGIMDIVLGASGHNGDGVSRDGTAYVVFGTEEGTAVDLSNLGTGGFRIDGVVSETASAAVVSAAGDVNGDGLADILIGIPFSERTDNAGEVFVVLGRTDSTPVDLANPADYGFRIMGISPGDTAGNSVGGAGDVDGDGFADIVIGARGFDLGELSSTGEAYIAFGKTGSEDILPDEPGSGVIRLQGNEAGGLAGSAVRGAGDVNGDGMADVVIGASGVNGNSGAAYVFFSTETAPAVSSYRAFARTGDAPPLAVGITGDGSNDSTPDSRCWIDFDAGNGPGNGGSSLQLVTLTRNNAQIANLDTDEKLTANVMWEIETDREGWSDVSVTFKYIAKELAGLDETTLELWHSADGPAGPWSMVTNEFQLDTNQNHITGRVDALGAFAVVGERAGIGDEWVIE